MTIEEARALLNDVRKRESLANSEYHRNKTEENNNALKKIKAERRKIVTLCKSVGMNVSPFGVEQPEGAPIWVKKKFRTETEKAFEPVKTQPNDPTPGKHDEKNDVQSGTADPEELMPYINFLKYLKSNNVITADLEKNSCDFVRKDFKKREEKLIKNEEMLKQLVDIGALSQENYESCLEALKKELFNL